MISKPAPPSGGGEPDDPGALCGGTGCQLCVHGLPQRGPEGDPGAWPLHPDTHHLPARVHREVPAEALLPLSYPLEVRKSLSTHKDGTGISVTSLQGKIEHR